MWKANRAPQWRQKKGEATGDSLCKWLGTKFGILSVKTSWVDALRTRKTNTESNSKKVKTRTGQLWPIALHKSLDLCLVDEQAERSLHLLAEALCW